MTKTLTTATPKTKRKQEPTAATPADLLDEFVQVPLDLVRKAGPRAAVVWGLVYFRGLNRPGCWLSLASISKQLGSSGGQSRFGVQAVRRCLQLLVEGGWLEMQERGSTGRTNLYRAVRYRDGQGAAAMAEPLESSWISEAEGVSLEIGGGIARDRGGYRQRYPTSNKTMKYDNDLRPVVVAAPASKPDPGVGEGIQPPETVSGKDNSGRALQAVKALAADVPGLAMTATLEQAIEAHPETAEANLRLALAHPGEWTPALVAGMIQQNARLHLRPAVRAKPKAESKRKKASGPEWMREPCETCSTYHQPGDCPEQDTSIDERVGQVVAAVQAQRRAEASDA